MVEIDCVVLLLMKEEPDAVPLDGGSNPQRVKCRLGREPLSRFWTTVPRPISEFLSCSAQSP